MKKKLFLRLCLILAVGVSALSCRTEEFHNEEETQVNTQFHLTSKRISLNESKHKAKLLPELQKAEVGIKAFAQKNAKGKIINYADGVSIDTDNVIYIENGPNYHTYTFRIKRENTLENAAVENLVLEPLSDGSYREILITYHLTPQEKQLLENGSFVDLTGKISSQELVQGTYGGNLMGKLTTTQCHWETATINVSCPCEGHKVGQECTCPKGKPKQYVLTWNVCEEVEIIAPTGGNTGGSSPSGGGGEPVEGSNPNQPCAGSEIPSQPLDPSSTLGTNEGCNPATPTLPILEFNPPANPCEKTKALLADLVVKNKIDSLEAQSVKLGTDKGEKAFLYMNDNTTSALITGEDHKVNLSLYSGYKGVYHNHTPYGTKMLAPYDILTLYKTVVYQQSSATAKDAFIGMVVHETCNCPPDNFVYHNYLLRFNGDFSETGAIATLSKEEMDKLRADYNKEMFKLESFSNYRTGDDWSSNLNSKGLEKLFFATLANMNIDPNQIVLQKIEKN